jgi:hypothetical protein
MTARPRPGSRGGLLGGLRLGLGLLAGASPRRLTGHARCMLYGTAHKNRGIKSVMTRNIPAPAAAATAIKVSSSMNSRHSIL